MGQGLVVCDLQLSKLPYPVAKRRKEERHKQRKRGRRAGKEHKASSQPWLQSAGGVGRYVGNHCLPACAGAGDGRGKALPVPLSWNETQRRNLQYQPVQLGMGNTGTFLQAPTPAPSQTLSPTFPGRHRRCWVMTRLQGGPGSSSQLSSPILLASLSSYKSKGMGHLGADLAFQARAYPQGGPGKTFMAYC